MTHRQLPPRYAVRFTELAPAHDPLHAHIQTRVATTLAGAKSMQRALVRQGYQMTGIYELLAVRLQTKPDELTSCGQFHREWEEEVRVT